MRMMALKVQAHPALLDLQVIPAGMSAETKHRSLFSSKISDPAFELFFYQDIIDWRVAAT